MTPHRAQPIKPALAAEATRARLMADAAVLAGALLLFGLIAGQMAPFVPDDSFISYRYAANWAGGAGLRFNPTDAPVEGYSNFLWIALLAGAARLGIEPEAAGPALGAVCGALALGLLWLLLRRRGHTGLNLAAPLGLLAVAGPAALYAVSGMETALFGFLLLATLVAVDGLLARPTAGRAGETPAIRSGASPAIGSPPSRWLWAGNGLLLAVMGVLVALARPEGVVVFPVVAACLVLFTWRGGVEERRTVWRSLIVAALVWLGLLLAYHLWRVNYFGAFWPTPFLAKGEADSPLTSLLTNARQFFVRQTHYYAPLAYYYAALALAAAAGAWLARRGGRRPVEWTALLLAAALAAFYANFVDWMPGMRYYAPLIGLLLLPLALLGPSLRGPARSETGDAAYGLLLATLALFSLSALATLRMEGQQLQAGTQASMVALGRWLHDAMPADATLAMSDVGATPYYAGLRTIDINPQSLTDRHIAENGWSADYFFAADPDVVAITAFSLTEPDFYSVHEELVALPRFAETYERIGLVRNDWYQDRSYWVFVRRGMLPDAQQMATFPPGIEKP